jgi:uncharacterized protein YndB with AHSA1/START domain
MSATPLQGLESVSVSLVPLVVSLLLLTGLALAGGSGDETPRVIVKETVVIAPVETVWHAWTTEEGLRFVSAKSRVELRPGGPYEWFLELEPDENGRRGGEGAEVISFVPGERLEFTWTFPPAVPTLRAARATTRAVVTLEDLGGGKTRVHFEQSGWQPGEDWDAGYAYFDKAWSAVLRILKEKLEAPPASETPSEGS